MNFTIERANPDHHYDALTTFLNQFEPAPIAAADIREWDRRNTRNILYRHVIPDNTGAIIGYSIMLHGSWHEPDEFYLWVGIDEAVRRQGMGQRLYEHALTLVRQHGGQSLQSEVGEVQAAGLAFAEHRGFTRKKHTFQSKLELSDFDESRFLAQVQRVQEQGIRFYSLADIPDTEAARRALYAINYRAALQDPGSNGRFPDFEEFTELTFARLCTKRTLTS